MQVNVGDDLGKILKDLAKREPATHETLLIASGEYKPFTVEGLHNVTLRAQADAGHVVIRSNGGHAMGFKGCSALGVVGFWMTGGGISLIDCENVSVSRNRVEDAGSGISVENSKHVRLERNEVVRAKEQGISVGAGEDNLVAGNVLHECKGGIKAPKSVSVVENRVEGKGEGEGVQGEVTPAEAVTEGPGAPASVTVGEPKATDTPSKPAQGEEKAV